MYLSIHIFAGLLYSVGMANFNTHITGAAAFSGLLSTMFLKAGFVSIPEAFVLAFGGMVGGILPDIDLKHSHPSKIVFTTLAVLIALTWVFSSNAALSVVELWIFGLALFLVIRYPVWAVFHRFTVHRGSLHSVAAALMFAVVSVVLAHRSFNQEAEFAWFVGLFIFIGCLFHLLLDELYSVDFTGVRIKRSFGSAMKIVDLDRLLPSSLIIFVTAVAWIYTPATGGLFKQLTASEGRERLFENFVPDELPGYLRSIVVAEGGVQE